jgi:hypothetical protein
VSAVRDGHRQVRFNPFRRWVGASENLLSGRSALKQKAWRVAEDKQDDSRDRMADLAGLKPAVEKLRDLLHAAAAAEEAAACKGAPMPAEDPEGPVSGSQPDDSVEDT